MMVRLGFELKLGSEEPDLLLPSVRPVEESQALIRVDENAKFWVSNLQLKVGLGLRTESGTREIRGEN